MVGNHASLATPAAASSPYRHAYEGDLVGPRHEDPGGHAAGVKAPGGIVVRIDIGNLSHAHEGSPPRPENVAVGGSSGTGYWPRQGLPATRDRHDI